MNNSKQTQQQVIGRDRAGKRRESGLAAVIEEENISELSTPGVPGVVRSCQELSTGVVGSDKISSSEERSQSADSVVCGQSSVSCDERDEKKRGGEDVRVPTLGGREITRELPLNLMETQTISTKHRDQRKIVLDRNNSAEPVMRRGVEVGRTSLPPVMSKAGLLMIILVSEPAQCLLLLRNILKLSSIR